MEHRDQIAVLLTSLVLASAGCGSDSKGGDSSGSGTGGTAGAGDEVGGAGGSVGGSASGGSASGGSASGGSASGGSASGGSASGGSASGGSASGGSASGGTSGDGGSAGNGGSSGDGGSGGVTATGGMGGASTTSDAGGMGGVGTGGGPSSSGGVGGTSTGGTEGTTTTTSSSSGSTTSGTGGVGATTTGETSTTGEPTVTELTITVTPDVNRNPISPWVYGVDGAERALDLGAKLTRTGGTPDNDSAGYNWEINATHLSNCSTVYSNAEFGEGSDPGSAVSEVLAAAETNDGAVMIPLAIGPYVAADTDADDVLETPDYLTTRFKQNLALKGSAFLTSPDTSDDFVYQDEFANWVMAQAGSVPVVFALDEHPALWSEQVCLIHPDKALYDDVVDLGVEFASAVKDVWPEVEVAGPVSYGWQEFVDLQHSGEYETKGEFLDYYLAQLAAAESDAGFRLLDYLDVEWFPEVNVEGTRITEEVSTPAVADARMQAPRSLWDPDYDEQSWVSGNIGGPIDLISRMQTKIDTNYPDTKLAFSAWYYGGGSHISGGIAAADVLGIFGREGVALASAWLPASAPFVEEAFRVYLDYDGAGAHFGDTSVSAVSDDVEGSSVFASIESSDEDQVVIVLLNKRGSSRDATITVDSDTSYPTCLVYELTADGATIAPAAPLDAEADNEFLYQMPPQSVAVLVPQQ